MAFVELFGKGFTIDPDLLSEILVSFSTTLSETDVDFLFGFNQTMTVAEAHLGVNTVNNMATRSETDISSSISGSTLSTTYIVGAPNALRYFWIRLVDDSGNESITPLGSYTTQDNTDPVISTFTMAAGTPATSEIDITISASDNDAVQTLYLWVSDTQTTAPTASAIKASGVALGGTVTSHATTGLSPGTTYYGWLLARDRVGNESAVTASTPTTITTASDTTPPTLDSSSLDPTPGFEESRLNITLSFSDSV